MGNLTGQIMKELQAQGKSEDWTVGFAKMANALYLKVMIRLFLLPSAGILIIIAPTYIHIH